MKHFINTLGCNQFFWLCGCLGGKCAFSWGTGGFELLLLPPALGLQMLLSVHEGNFQMLVACPSLRENDSAAAACSTEEPQGIPAEKIQAAGLNVVRTS